MYAIYHSSLTMLEPGLFEFYSREINTIMLFLTFKSGHLCLGEKRTSVLGVNMACFPLNSVSQFWYKNESKTIKATQPR